MGSTRKIVHEEQFSTSCERIFSLLVTPSAIRDWWGTSTAIVLPEKGGFWAATWGQDQDDPDYIASAAIAELESPSRMVLENYQYYSKSGPLPFAADIRTEFLVSAANNESKLTVIQDGIPSDSVADDYYQGCVKGWKDNFDGIRRFLSKS